MRKNKFFFVQILAFAVLWMARPAAADYKQAIAHYEQGRYKEAIQAIRPDVDKNPNWEPGHRLLGLCYLNQNNNALAVSSLLRAVELKSQTFSTYYGLALAYFNMQRYDNSISALNQGESFAGPGEKARLYSLRGKAHFQLKRYGEAANDLTNAIRGNQANWTDYSMLGISYLSLNRIDEAIQALEKANSMKPGQSAVADALAQAWFKKGTSALGARQYGQAIQALLKARDHDPRNGYVHYNLGEAYLFEKRYSEAEKALSQAATLMPRSVDVYARQGLVYEKQKKWDLALNAYKKADEISPSKQLKEAIDRINENKKSSK